MNRLRLFLSSMAGRLFVILLLGMLSSAILVTVLAEGKRRQELNRQALIRTADRLQGYVELLDTGSSELRARLLDLGGPGMRTVSTELQGQRPDTELTAILAERPAPVDSARVNTLARRHCQPRLPAFAGAAGDQLRDGDASRGPSTCRLVALTLSDGTPLQLRLASQPIARSPALATDPMFLLLLALAIAVLAYVVARIASAPLQRLGAAAIELGQDLQRPPLAVTGPLEVRRAAQAFNAMQQRLQRHLGERTQMLAAITHDLQTPLTRMRLRLENVADEALRERLIGDLAAMHALIREGLELARSAETTEQRVALDLDSLLESIVEDAAESGGEVRFEQGCGAVLLLRPLAMHRLFSNLVDNAIKYGHSAAVAAVRQGDAVVVRVSDSGPGLAETDLEAVFDPFVRMETSRSRATGGAGLGLTIARTLAEKDGAALTLRNRPEGGLVAEVRWEAPDRAAPRD